MTEYRPVIAGEWGGGSPLPHCDQGKKSWVPIFATPPRWVLSVRTNDVQQAITTLLRWAQISAPEQLSPPAPPQAAALSPNYPSECGCSSSSHQPADRSPPLSPSHSSP